MDKIEWVEHTNCKVISMLDKFLDKLDRLTPEERSIIMRILAVTNMTYIYNPVKEDTK